MADDPAADDGGETTAGDGDGSEPTPEDSGATDTTTNGDEQVDAVGADEQHTGGASPFVFLLGLLAFVGSIVAFAADLLTGYDPLRSLLVNAAGAVVLVWWAGADTLSDPDSDVTSRSGAAGTGLLLLGIYLLLGAAIVGVTSLVHDRFGLVPWAAGIGVVAIVVGFLIFPRGSVLGDDGTTEPSGREDGTAASDDGPGTGTGEGDGDEANDGKTDG